MAGMLKTVSPILQKAITTILFEFLFLPSENVRNNLNARKA